MIVGALRLIFLVPESGKSTKSIIQKIKTELSTRFKAAFAELQSKGGSPGEVIVGVSIVAHNETQGRERLEQIVRYFQEWGHAELVSDEKETIHFDDLEIERDFEKYNP